MNRDYPRYVPARVAAATLTYREGVQAEQLLAELELLRKEAVSNLKCMPPSFLVNLDGEIRRAKLLRDVLRASGPSAEERARRFAPERIPPEARTAGWGFSGLFASVPEVTLEDGGRCSVNYETWSGALAAQATDTLEGVLVDATRERDERLRAAATLGTRTGAAVALIRALEDDDERLVTVVAESLSRLGEDAEPALVAALGSPTRHSSSAMMHCMWALVRRGNANPSVIAALRRVSAGAPGPVSQYGLEALNALGVR